MGNYIALQHYDSPCGMLLLAAHNNHLCMCDWANSPHRELTDRKLQLYFQAKFSITESATTTKAAMQLDEYFEKKRNTFSIPIILAGTKFQNTVWDTLNQIHYGKTCSYKDIANLIGQGKSIRAVANAIGANPISIIIPCHRVIGSNNSLTGYAGGLKAKQILLSLENS